MFFILLRRDIRVLRIAPILPQTKIMLAKIIQGLSKKKYISYAIESFPDLEKYQKFERRFYFDEAFKRYEGWQDVYYKFDKVSKASKDEYVYGFKNITCSYTFWKVLEIHLIIIANLFRSIIQIMHMVFISQFNHQVKMGLILTNQLEVYHY